MRRWLVYECFLPFERRIRCFRIILHHRFTIRLFLEHESPSIAINLWLLHDNSCYDFLNTNFHQLPLIFVAVMLFLNTSCHLIVVNSWSLHGNSCEITNNDYLGDCIEFGPLWGCWEWGGCIVLSYAVLLQVVAWFWLARPTVTALQRYSAVRIPLTLEK